MHAVRILSGIVVICFGVFLWGLALTIVGRPLIVDRFFCLFASSARAHYTEQVLRLIAGLGVVGLAPWMPYSLAFIVFGWVMTGTAVGLLLVPWRWHHRFGQWAIPFAIRYKRLIGVGAFSLGTLLIYGAYKALLTLPLVP